MPASVIAWQTWFAAWFAAYWTPDMIPGLRVVIKAYDEVERGHVKAADRTALHSMMRSYGITPDGQMALRWSRPKEEERPSQSQPAAGDHYAHLKVVND